MGINYLKAKPPIISIMLTKILYVLINVSEGRSMSWRREEDYSSKTVVGYALPGRVTFLNYKSPCKVQQNMKETVNPYDGYKNL